MKYRKIGETTVSLLGFGCMRLPQLSDGNIDEAASFALWDRALQQGVTYFDTAYLYHDGASELVLGKWLKTVERSKVQIATKLPLWDIESRANAIEIFDEQLRKLDTTYIDFYLLHAIRKSNWQLIKKFGILDILKEYQSQGKIKQLGFSFHDDFSLFSEVIQAFPWDFCQIQLNYMDENYQAGAAGCNLAASLGVPIVIMEPLKGGLLASLPTAEYELLATDETAAKLAFRWLTGQAGIAVILSGMSTLSQLEENLTTFNELQALSQQEADNIKAVVDTLNSKILVPCTSCGYCLPCEFGVDIPNCFKYLNVGSRYDNFKIARTNYGFNVGDNKASNCRNCGACLAKCPQQIPIPERLQLVVEKLED